MRPDEENTEQINLNLDEDCPSPPVPTKRSDLAATAAVDEKTKLLKEEDIEQKTGDTILQTSQPVPIPPYDGVHQHCLTCISTACGAQEICPIIPCGMNCGVMHHLCKRQEHQLTCTKAKRPCLLACYGCTYHGNANDIVRHLITCRMSEGMRWKKYRRCLKDKDHWTLSWLEEPHQTSKLEEHSWLLFQSRRTALAKAVVIFIILCIAGAVLAILLK